MTSSRVRGTVDVDQDQVLMQISWSRGRKDRVDHGSCDAYYSGLAFAGAVGKSNILVKHALLECLRACWAMNEILCGTPCPN